MKKSEIAKQFDYKATTFLFTAVIALALNSLLNMVSKSIDANVVAEAVLVFFVIASSVFADIMTIKGFFTVNKSCKLSEANQNYYMGKNLTIMTVVCIVVGIILSFVAIFLSVMLAQYEQLESLTSADEQARMNLIVITSIVNICLQFAAISTPYIVYLWKLHKIIPKTDVLNNFALLTVVIFVVQLIIGIMNSLYIVKGSHSTFLAGFSEVLLVVKYLAVTMFFLMRRRSILISSDENTTKN